MPEWEGSDEDSDVEVQESRDVLPPRSLSDSIVALRSAPTTLETDITSSSTKLDNHLSLENHCRFSTQSQAQVQLTQLALIEDAKFYQDAAIGYQDAYETLQIQQEELQHWYTQQAQLVEETSEAL